MLLLFLLGFAAVAPVFAQTPVPVDQPPDRTTTDEETSDEPTPEPAPLDEDAPVFLVEKARIYVRDKHKRLYLMPRDQAWIGVRLHREDEKRNKELEASYQDDAIEAEGIRYEVVDDPEFVKFPLSGGSAEVSFVVFSDPSLNPVNYELVLMERRKGQIVRLPLSKSEWVAGDGQTSAHLTTSKRAPNQTWEWAAVISFLVVSLVLAYILYGRSLFNRMLRVKKMEVGSALGWSNLLFLGGLGLILIAGLVMYFFPVVLWSKPYMIYLLAAGGCLLILAAGYGAGILMTRA